MMITDPALIDECYRLTLLKDSEAVGVFYLGVRTTGIFCRPNCTARKPLKKNCEFFKTAQAAVLSGYRPCKRCRPLDSRAGFSPEVRVLIEAVEADPLRKWTNKDLDGLAISAHTARRQFQKYFGMTFISYARARRLGLAFREIREGTSVIDTQHQSGYNSGNGFRDAFVKTMGEVPSRGKQGQVLSARWIETRLGAMLAISNDTELLLLEFSDRRGLEKEIERLRKKFSASIVPGDTVPLQMIEEQLEQYFAGERTDFDVPISAKIGSDFQQQVWKQLRLIPAGQTWSYKQLAAKVGGENKARAAANANGSNQLALIIPCHRVIAANGGLGGYGGGMQRKQWLLEHERKSLQQAE